MLVSKIPFLFGVLRSGDVVVFNQPGYGTLIKLVDEVEPGSVTVIGLDAGSVDSRSFGRVSRSDLIGKVIWHIRKPESGITKL